MSTAGPALPPHLLAKRKREAESEEAPALGERVGRRTTSPESPGKRRRRVGPAPPPATGSTEDEDENSSSDDAFGPVPLSKSTAPATYVSDSEDEHVGHAQPISQPETRAGRDAWMMMPPQQDGLAARMDPTKVRPRKFNTGKTAGNFSGSSDESVWTETPEQKRKRLEHAVLGIETTAGGTGGRSEPRRSEKAEQAEKTADRVARYNEKTRGASLYEQHKSKEDAEREDDPSKRAFDWEKDMKSNTQMGHSQRREVMDKASQFGSRYSGGKYL